MLMQEGGGGGGEFLRYGHLDPGWNSCLPLDAYSEFLRREKKTFVGQHVQFQLTQIVSQNDDISRTH